MCLTKYVQTRLAGVDRPNETNLTSVNMRPTCRILTYPRAKSISFVGLGRMGSEMAYNLFSKRFTEANDSRFVVCDAIPAAATRFTENFQKRFPRAHITIAATPEECVYSVRCVPI